MISNGDRKVFNNIIEEIEKLDVNDDNGYYQNIDKMIKILTKNLNDTIDFLNICSKKELDWASTCFDDLCEYFQSQELIDCVENNITRFNDESLQEQLKMEFESMKFYLKK
jgi:hypothetical protein